MKWGWCPCPTGSLQERYESPCGVFTEVEKVGRGPAVLSGRSDPEKLRDLVEVKQSPRVPKTR